MFYATNGWVLRPEEGAMVHLLAHEIPVGRVDWPYIAEQLAKWATELPDEPVD